MKWTEIIQLRTIRETLPSEVVTDLEQSFEGEHVGILIMRHADVPTDIAIHLTYETDGASEPDRTLGHRLFAALEEFGLVSRSLWVTAHEYKRFE